MFRSQAQPASNAKGLSNSLNGRQNLNSVRLNNAASKGRKSIKNSKNGKIGSKSRSVSKRTSVSKSRNDLPDLQSKTKSYRQPSRQFGSSARFDRHLQNSQRHEIEDAICDNLQPKVLHAPSFMDQEILA